MDNLRIYTLLNVRPAGLLITGIKITLWGKQLALDCLYDPEEQNPFRLTFKDCQNISWQIVDDQVDERDVWADVIDILLGENNYRKPATIITDIFEISVSYGELKLRKDW